MDIRLDREVEDKSGPRPTRGALKPNQRGAFAYRAGPIEIQPPGFKADPGKGGALDPPRFFRRDDNQPVAPL